MFSFANPLRRKQGKASSAQAPVELTTMNEHTSKPVQLYARPLNSQSAMVEVLAMPELLENILLHLPIPQLLLNAQLVSTYFYEIIQESPAIQQALFLAPAPMDRLYVSRPNPFLAHHETSQFIDERRHELVDKRGDMLWPEEACLAQMDWTRWVSKNKEFIVRNSSWRKMQLVQPPIKELIFFATTISNKDGVVWGQLENSAMMKWDKFHITRDGTGTLCHSYDGTRNMP